MNEDNNTSVSDSRLKELFGKELPQAPRNPWFVRKVMNRLPPKNTQAYSWIEYASYTIAAICLIAGWCHIGAGIKEAGVFTGGDLINMLALCVVSVIIAISFLAPRVRRWLNDI